MLESSRTYDRETTPILHASGKRRYWMRILEEKSLEEFLDERDAPFRDPD